MDIYDIIWFSFHLSHIPTEWNPTRQAFGSWRAKDFLRSAAWPPNRWKDPKKTHTIADHLQIGGHIIKNHGNYGNSYIYIYVYIYIIIYICIYIYIWHAKFLDLWTTADWRVDDWRRSDPRPRQPKFSWRWWSFRKIRLWIARWGWDLGILRIWLKPLGHPRTISCFLLAYRFLVFYI